MKHLTADAIKMALEEVQKVNKEWLKTHPPKEACLSGGVRI